MFNKARKDVPNGEKAAYNAGKVKIIIACGTSVATSAIVETLLREKLKDNKVRGFEIYRKRIYDLPMEIKQINPDIVMTTSPVDPAIVKDVVYYPAMCFLTGGADRDRIISEIIQYIKERTEKKE